MALSAATAPGPLDEPSVPLCVELDGALVRTHTLLESLLVLARQHPRDLWRVPLWLAGGKAYFKRALAACALPAVETLPYREDLIARLSKERARGRRLVLVTAADQRIAGAVAAHTGLFDLVLASDGRTNLSGALRRQALAARFSRFDYIERVSEPAPNRLKTLAQAVRVRQWVKNLLVLVPAIAAHVLWRGPVLRLALLALAGLCLTTSAGHLLEGLTGLDDDRGDPIRRLRPLASGALPIGAALLLVPTLLAAGVWVGRQVDPMVAWLLVGHFVAGTWYSLSLKRIALVDAMALAGLYLLRFFIGAAAVDVPVSPWLLGVAMFLFMSLALMKRASELRRLCVLGLVATPGRGYRIEDLQLTLVLGIASGYMTVLILGLYIHSPDVSVLYEHPERLWILCPLLFFWVSRLWLLASRGEVDADPVAFTLKDRCSQGIGVVGLVLGWAAS